MRGGTEEKYAAPVARARARSWAERDHGACAGFGAPRALLFPVTPFGGTLAQVPSVCACAPESLPSPAFRYASANSRLFAVAPPRSFTCSETAAEVGRGWGSFLRARAAGLWAAATVYLLAQTGERRLSPLGSVAPVRKPGTWARRQSCCPEVLATRWSPWRGESARSPRRGGWAPEIYGLSALALRSHSLVVLAKAVVVEFSLRWWRSA